MINVFGFNCNVIKEGVGKNTRYSLFSPEEGPVAVINIPSLNKSETVIAVKNYSKNAGMLEALQEAGVVKEIVGYKKSGFVNIPIVEIDQAKMLAL